MGTISTQLGTLHLLRGFVCLEIVMCQQAERKPTIKAHCCAGIFEFQREASCWIPAHSNAGREQRDGRGHDERGMSHHSGSWARPYAPGWVQGSCGRAGKNLKMKNEGSTAEGLAWRGLYFGEMYEGQLELGREKQQQTLGITHVLLPSDQTFCSYIKGKQLGKPKL